MSDRAHNAPPLLSVAVAVLTGTVALVPALPSVAAAVGWPPSSGLLLSEIQTGGAGASDEFVEIYNAGTAPLDLAGSELVYVTASGGTITRKAAWTSSTALPPGGHLLVANIVGSYAPGADLTYSGGLAATGGALVLRLTGGEVVDAVGWGDAVNAFVEGTAAPAPPAGSSLERLPGGLAGSGVDTNDNLADFQLRALADPQGSFSEPTPWNPETPSPSPSPTSEPNPSPTPSLEPTPTASDPPTPAPSPSPSPSLEPTPTATEPSTPAPSPTPTAAPISVLAARGLPAGSVATLTAVLTTPLGLTETGRGAFVQDATGGIALYLATADWAPLPMGTAITVRGTVDSRYGQATLRLAAATDVVAAGLAELPRPVGAATGGVGEPHEGVVVRVTGEVTEGPTTLTDGYAATVDDGSGPLRLIVASVVGLDPSALARGARVALEGVVGQRDTTGTGSGGYRLHLRSPEDLTPLPGPTPAPTTSPAPPPTPTPTPAPSTTPSPTASPTPGSAGDEFISIAEARALPFDRPVVVRGVVTAEVGRVSDDRSLAIQDASGGIVVRLDGSDRRTSLTRGAFVEVAARTGARHDNAELRLGDDGRLGLLGTAPLPEPLAIRSAQLSESVEGRLVTLRGQIVETSATATGTLSLIVEDASGRGRVVLLAATGARRESFPRGADVAVVGVAGQYSSAHGRLDGYRVWARDAADVAILDLPHATPGATARPRGAAGQRGSTGRPGGRPIASRHGPLDPSALDVELGQLAHHEGRLVRVAGLIDGIFDGFLTIDDGTGRARIPLPGTLAPVVAEARLGDALNAVGTVRAGVDGEWQVVPRGPDDLALAGSVTSTDGEAAASPPIAEREPASPSAAHGADSSTLPAVLAVGLLGLGALLIAGRALLRRRMERTFSLRVRERLVDASAGARRRVTGDARR